MKEIKSRIILKHDNEINWNKASSFIPKQGEVIIYDVDDNYTYERMKIGDGITNVIDLPFIIQQADWNENDETKAGYIKNRTHYEEIGSEVLVETTIDIDEDGGYEDIDISELEVGKLYTVTLNGTVYECVAWYHNDLDSICIGNGSMCEAEDFGGDEPFYIESWETDGEYYVVFNAETAGTYTIKIECVANIIHKLDEKFISYKPGLKVEGKEFTVDRETVIAAKGAEIFNDYKNNKATGYYSHAEGEYTTASGIRSHAEGDYTTASGQAAHAEGLRVIASGGFSHAEGDHTAASGFISHAEGCETIASGSISHAEGCETIASGSYSHAEGYLTIASSQSQHVQGEYNIEDSEDKYAHIVGNGTYSTRSNAHTLDWNGNAEFQGDVIANGCGGDKPISLTELHNHVYKVPTEILLKDIENGYVYLLQMKGGTLVTSIATSSISVITTPNKTTYMEGDVFDPTGMVVTATYVDGTTREITDYTCSEIVDGVVTISYKVGSIVHTTNIAVNVEPFNPDVALVDFEYTDNGDGTYTLTAWKQTLNGVSSTEMVIPNNSNIIL